MRLQTPPQVCQKCFDLTSYFVVIILFHLQLSLGGSTGRDSSKGWFPAAYGVQSKTEQPRVLPACDNFQWFSWVFNGVLPWRSTADVLYVKGLLMCRHTDTTSIRDLNCLHVHLQYWLLSCKSQQTCDTHTHITCTPPLYKHTLKAPSAVRFSACCLRCTVCWPL